MSKPHPERNPLMEDVTLRDLFAAAALTGLASNNCAPDYSRGACNDALVKRAWVLADAMLRAREVADDVA